MERSKSREVSFIPWVAETKYAVAYIILDLRQSYWRIS